MGAVVAAGASVTGADVAGAEVAGADVAGALGAQAETIKTKSVIRLKAKYLFDMVVSPLTWLMELIVLDYDPVLYIWLPPF